MPKYKYTWKEKVTYSAEFELDEEFEDDSEELWQYVASHSEEIMRESIEIDNDFYDDVEVVKV